MPLGPLGLAMPTFYGLKNIGHKNAITEVAFLPPLIPVTRLDSPNCILCQQDKANLM